MEELTYSDRSSEVTYDNLESNISERIDQYVEEQNRRLEEKFAPQKSTTDTFTLAANGHAVHPITAVTFSTSTPADTNVQASSWKIPEVTSTQLSVQLIPPAAVHTSLHLSVSKSNTTTSWSNPAYGLPSVTMEPPITCSPSFIYPETQQLNQLGLSTNPTVNSTNANLPLPVTSSVVASTLNPYVPIFVPTLSQVGICTQFTNFLLKKDILMSRLSRFTDDPEFYSVWRSSFKGIMSDLGVSPPAEMDLLVKWLGPGSSKQAMSIRSAYPNDPRTGISRIWERLEDRYASPEIVDACLKTKVAEFQKLTNMDSKQLFELLDLAAEIAARKEDAKHSALLSYYDSSSGVNQIVSKLPSSLQEKWTNAGVRYKKQHSVAYPPFTFFVSFLRDLAKARNDPGFRYEQNVANTGIRPQTNSRENQPIRRTVSSRNTDVNDTKFQPPSCPLYLTKHTLNKCRAFRAKPLEERRQFLRENSICFKCCGPNEHLSENCKAFVKCFVCGSTGHPSALHVEQASASAPQRSHGGENSTRVKSTCTQICGSSGGMSKSCAKIVLVCVYPAGHRDKALRLYAILDDQSNQTLARSCVFDFFGEQGSQTEHTLASCSDCISKSGRKASDYIVESLGGSASFELPAFIECDKIPNSRDEIPTPQAAFHHAHLREIAEQLPPLDPLAEISMLIGRDLPAAHHVLEQKIGPHDGPYAQRLQLGWVLVGEVCLGSAHRTSYVTSNKTCTLLNGRPSLMEPCSNCFQFKDEESKPGFPIFSKSTQDNKPGLSFEDKSS